MMDIDEFRKIYDEVSEDMEISTRFLDALDRAGYEIVPKDPPCVASRLAALERRQENLQAAFDRGSLVLAKIERLEIWCGLSPEDIIGNSPGTLRQRVEKIEAWLRQSLIR